MRFFFALILTLLPALAHAAPQTATINSAQISYEVCGAESAPAVVLLHDGLANAALWDPVWANLCEKFHVLRYDRRGYGRSPAAKEVHSPTDDLAALMRHAGFAHAHLIGAFTGAAIALDFVIDYPEMSDRLVLATPTASGFRTSESMIRRLQRIEEPIRKGDMDAVIAVINADPHFMGPQSTTARDKLAVILKESPGDLGEHPRQRRRSDTARFLREIYSPTLIVAGSRDDPFNLAIAGVMDNEMRAAAVQVIPEGGHLAYFEQPVLFVSMVSAFLADC